MANIFSKYGKNCFVKAGRRICKAEIKRGHICWKQTMLSTTENKPCSAEIN